MLSAQFKSIIEDIMKKFLLIPVICALTASCNSNSDNSNGNSQVQTQPADWDITAHVKAQLLSDNSLSASARVISVTTNDGVVTLTGTVINNEEMRKVIRIVQSVPGVTDVDNQLTTTNS
jgi:hyperosmotically inducible periplasmic protein